MQNAKNINNEGFTFEILKEIINSGNYGTVYKARKIKNGIVIPFACKKINYRYLCQQTSYKQDYILECLKREIKLSFSLDHQNLIKCQHYYIDDGCVYIFMELMDNSLLDFINIKCPSKSQTYMSFDEVRYIFKELLKIINYLQKEKNVCHRDIKFQNILIRKKDPNIQYQDANSAFNLEIKIADLGTAKQYYTDGKFNPKLTQQTGTLQYQPPEVIQGNLDQLTEDQKKEAYKKHDSWSMGVILYRLIYNIYLFNCEKIQENVFIQKVLSQQIKFDLRQNIPEDLFNIVQNLLKPNIDDRYVCDELLQMIY